MKDYYVTCYDNGKFVWTVSGLGRNKGKLDNSHTKRTAQKYAKQLSKKEHLKNFVFKVENNVVGETFGEYRNGKRI